MKILILEDNKRLSNVMRQALEAENYKVDCYYDGDEALEVLENGYACFILDINVPNLDGISILEAIRLNHKNTPVIVISSNHDLDKVKISYELGCDDYLKKPFYIFELVQKVKKFSKIEKCCLYFDDNNWYDCKNRMLYKDENEIEVTKKEILFFELFSKNLHHIATYNEIEEYVWEGENTTLVNIRAMIKRLRKKIPHESIVIIKGVGYSLNKGVFLK